MPDILLFAIVIIGGVFAIPFLTDDEFHPMTKVGYSTLLLFISGWFTLYTQADWKYSGEKDTKVYIVDNAAVVNTGTKIVNLNDEFKRQFEEGAAITVKNRQRGFYYGVIALGPEMEELEVKE